MPPKPKQRSGLSSMRKDELILLMEGVLILLDQHERGLYDLMTDWQNDMPNQVRRQMINLEEDVPAYIRAPLQGQMLDLAEDVLTHVRMRMRDLHEPLLRMMIDLKLRP